MLQFVVVADHTYCRDLPILNFERGRRKFTISFQRDETRQSVDEPGTNKLRTIFPEKS